jgi:hypothetical protein
LNALGDFWGKITGGDATRVSETKAPPLSGYPSQDDAREALKYGFGYGTGNEPYIESHRARIMGDTKGKQFKARSAAGMMIDDAIKAVDDPQLAKMLDLDKVSNWGLKEKLGTTFAQAALAANRNPIATLGFDPSRTVMDVVMKGANIGGAYEAKRDAIYANIDSVDPSSVLHESIHRGLEKLRQKSPEAAELIKSMGAEEYTVRYLMYKYAGDPEGKSGDIDAKQRKSGIWAFDENSGDWTGKNRKSMDKLLEIAADLHKQERPRGPH